MLEDTIYMYIHPVVLLLYMYIVYDTVTRHIILYIMMQEPVPYTSLDDAFDCLLQFMDITTRKCQVRITFFLRY